MKNYLKHKLIQLRINLLAKFCLSEPYNATTQSLDTETLHAVLANTAITPIPIKQPKIFK
jgi:hypothetical protein